ncbi:MAG: hypothetical protein ACO4AJ_05890, partial [Prochlorothrix sp.]
MSPPPVSSPPFSPSLPAFHSHGADVVYPTRDGKPLAETYNHIQVIFALIAMLEQYSDNIPGVKGVGYKTLSKRFQKFTEGSEYILSDLLLEAKSKVNNKGPRIFSSIVNEENLIKRNI